MTAWPVCLGFALAALGWAYYRDTCMRWRRMALFYERHTFEALAMCTEAQERTSHALVGERAALGRESLAFELLKQSLVQPPEGIADRLRLQVAERASRRGGPN